MTKSMERLIEKVVNTSGNNAKELERVEFVNGLIISDCIQCNSPFKGDKLYISVDENTNIIVFNDEGGCECIVWDEEYKTHVEKAVKLTIALMQLAF